MDSVGVADGNSSRSDITLSDISKMKVADLRAELKSRGLPINGNKTELVERLQASLLSSGKDFEVSEPSDDVNEDDVLADDSLLNDEGKELEEDLLGKDLDSLTAEVQKPKLPEKNRIALTRTTVIAASPEDKIAKPANTKTKVSITSIKSPSENGKVASKPTLSEEERRILRAKRFNITSEDIKLKTRSDRFGIINKIASSSTSSNSTPAKVALGAAVDILKKRADRFGQNVSTVMKQIESKDKMLKRKERFGTVIPSSTPVGLSVNEQEKKKIRAQRFGVS